MTLLTERFPARRIADDDDVGRNPSANEPLIAKLSRRGLLGSAGAGAALAMAGKAEARSLDFEQPVHEIRDDDQVAKGYSAEVLIRWGDKVLAEAPDWQAGQPDFTAQDRQFGYNNDFLAFLPLPHGSQNSRRGLLHVNHEYTNIELMDPTYQGPETITREQVFLEVLAHGGSLIEVERTQAGWQIVADSAHARRITAQTDIRISGPAAGHDLMKTRYDPEGLIAGGTLNNCAGGVTPWGTVLMAEENFHQYFGGGDAETAAQAARYRRYGIASQQRYQWYRHAPRFNLANEPNEPNRFGWIVEYDPYEPGSMPVKRTALGRFKHEGAGVVVNADGRLVVYSGDDERFEYLYRFVSARPVDPVDRAANRDLLDHGTLSVARFDDDGSLVWLPLIFGAGPLTPKNGFASQGDVLIDTRRAADLLGATPLDRPEDVEISPANGRVYAMLTNNSRRTPEQVDFANPRADNAHGHILELIAPGGQGRLANHAADRFEWRLFLLAGNPAEPGDRAVYHPATDIWLSSPDNCAFDPAGRLWIATDQGSNQKERGIPDGMYVCETDGPDRALVRFFYGAPRDAEMCGPAFTPDGTTLFVAVQHPGEGSTFAEPSTRWPDFREDTPPRPAVVAITRDDGGPVGG